MMQALLFDKATMTDLVRAPECRLKLGDIWACANRDGVDRAYVGMFDASNKDLVYRFMAGQTPTLLHGDVPYGINLTGLKSKQIGGGSKIYRAVMGDENPFQPQDFIDLYPDVDKAMWGANHYANRLPNSPFWIVWFKRTRSKGVNFDFADGEAMWCWKGGKGLMRVIQHVWDGYARDSENQQERVHPTQKPVAVMDFVLEWFDPARVLDLYAGSGPMLPATLNKGGTYWGVEFDGEYAEYCLKRAEARGLTPRLLYNMVEKGVWSGRLDTQPDGRTDGQSDPAPASY